jgi:hypothetical protein
MWLLAGWLLMLPPDDKPSAPVETWSQEEAFDTARACEESRHNPPKYLLDAVVKLWIESRCVPAEYIYPPKKPSAQSPARAREGQ